MPSSVEQRDEGTAQFIDSFTRAHAGTDADQRDDDAARFVEHPATGAQPVYVSTLRAARACGVGKRTFQRWIAEGLIKPNHTTPGGHHRWHVPHVLAMVRAYRQGPIAEFDANGVLLPPPVDTTGWPVQTPAEAQAQTQAWLDHYFASARAARAEA